MEKLWLETAHLRFLEEGLPSEEALRSMQLRLCRMAQLQAQQDERHKAWLKRMAES